MKFRNVNTQEIVEMSLKELLEEINRDRTEDWEPYNSTDWHEGLQFSDYELIEHIEKEYVFTIASVVKYTQRVIAENEEEAKMIGLDFFNESPKYFKAETVITNSIVEEVK
jgi:hypothetical protein